MNATFTRLLNKAAVNIFSLCEHQAKTWIVFSIHDYSDLGGLSMMQK